MQADYASGTGTKTLTFRYTVAASDADSDGISIGASALALNGGTIVDARDGATAASLGLGSNAIANAAAHKVGRRAGTGGGDRADDRFARGGRHVRARRHGGRRR